MRSLSRRSDFIGAIAGVLFVVLVFVGIASVDPKRGVSDQELLRWWADSGNRDGFVFSMYAFLLACPAFLFFNSRLRARLGTRDEQGWADTVFACGNVFTAVLGVEAITRGVIARSVRLADEPLPGVDTLRFGTDLAYFTWDLVILIAALMVGLTSILALSAGALPRWLGWLGVPVCAACLIAVAIQVAAFAIPAMLIWVLANCANLARNPTLAVETHPALRTEISATTA